MCDGIDPNRNFASHFGTRGVSNNPCSDIYPGKEAFSENNTRAMRNYIMDHLRYVISRNMCT